MQGYTDTPIERLENDVMDVKVYVESLSEFILGCSTPMTIAIQGDWGSGKTSMMNMIKQALADKIVPVWFNTWQYSQFEMASYLSISLLSNFLEKIGAEEESQNFLRSIAKGAIGFAKTAAVVGIETVAGGTIAGNLKEKLAEFGTQDSAKALEELRDKIREAVSAKLKSSGKNRIVVFVDDLDRLAPEKAVELLEVLKVFMDVPNCVFVLAVDYAVVTQGLEKKFGVSVGHSKGKSFFDKIIQLPFAISIAQYNISAYIQNLLSNMSIVCSEEEISTYREIVNFSIGCNPRSMKRLFNSFILLNTVASKKGMFNEADDIKAKDKQRILFASLCLQMAFQEIYEFMIKNKNELDADFFDGIKDFEKLKTDSAFEEIRKNIPV
ncbi:MAG: AAA family ATPase [Candidatus Contendobacter sp.]|nr:MAG: AAA family ATPase [Candidatus Contendobacter sp.]